MRGPVVSVLIPTYNGATWLAEALDSAIGQSYPMVEILVVDDASSDGTVEVAERFARLDGRVRLFKHTQRAGLAENWNRAVQHARGEYLKFLFQDDLLAPECIGRMVTVAESNASVGLVLCRRELLLPREATPSQLRWAQTHRDPTRDLRLAPVTPGHDVLRRVAALGLSRNLLGEPTAALVRRAAIPGSFDKRLRQAVDFEMWLRILAGWDLAFVPEQLVSFRVHGGSESARNDDRLIYAIDRVWLTRTLTRALSSLPKKRRLALWTRAYVRMVIALMTGLPGTAAELGRMTTAVRAVLPGS